MIRALSMSPPYEGRTQEGHNPRRVESLSFDAMAVRRSVARVAMGSSGWEVVTLR